MDSVWLAKKFLKEIAARRKDTKDAMLSGCSDFSQYEFLRGRYSSLADAENIFRELLGKNLQDDIQDTGT
tara:strand:- start:836 stop:1045 length:210 start_codon:yes stop_codon:yes gene_type:complete